MNVTTAIATPAAAHVHPGEITADAPAELSKKTDKKGNRKVKPKAPIKPS